MINLPRFESPGYPQPPPEQPPPTDPIIPPINAIEADLRFSV